MICIDIGDPLIVTPAQLHDEDDEQLRPGLEE